MGKNVTTTRILGQAQEDEVTQLRNALKGVDLRSKSGLSEIASIARLALCTLETQDGYSYWEAIAHALKAIMCRADETMDAIEAVAEHFNCCSVDAAEQRRITAYQDAMDRQFGAMVKGHS